MSDALRPQVYLLSPAEFSLASFPDLLAAILDSVPVACMRLRLASSAESDVTRAADALREVAHARDVPLVIENHLKLVEPLGLDGVHLSDGPKTVRHARKELGGDAIVGAFCGGSSHEGMSAGEAGADYISFGPLGETLLGSGAPADAELFQWWSEVIELPCVAEGALDADLVRGFAPVTDFFAFGDEIWRMDDPRAELRRLVDAIR